MDRRTFMASGALATALLAGCIQSGGTATDTAARSTDTTSSTATATPAATAASGAALYDTADEEQLLPDTSVFPSGWESEPVEDGGTHDLVFSNEDRTAAVWLGVAVFDTVSGARERYRQADQQAAGTDWPSLADEAEYDERTNFAYVIFRDSNAFGLVWASRDDGDETVPDLTAAREYARELYESMQERRNA